MLNIHQKFCRETFYDGKLVDFKPVYQDNFNFAYDVIDVIAQAEPERRAMLWCNDKGEEHTFTFFRPGKILQPGGEFIHEIRNRQRGHSGADSEAAL